MKIINKIILRNFKRFRTFEVDFDNQLNILVNRENCALQKRNNNEKINFVIC